MTPPSSTYRLQFHAGFRFEDACAAVPYLNELGVSHLYASPVFQARKRSMHGYDTVDFSRLNPELGSDTDFHILCEALRERGMGWIQDLVANHMAFDKDNLLLMDVLENGERSAYDSFFDIAWDHPYTALRGRVLAPFLGSSFGLALENGDLSLGFGPEGLRVHYYEHAFPLSPKTCASFFGCDIDRLKSLLGEEDSAFIRFLGLLYVLRTLSELDDPGERAIRLRIVKRAMWELYQEKTRIRNYIDRNLELYNGQPGRPDSFDLLEALLRDQHYRLSFWKVATEEINYRRFFNVNDLICLRQEDRRVFDATHVLPLRMLDQGVFSGLRIDHVDGFYDPVAYLDRLRDRMGDRYLVVEKILASGEDLPSRFPVHGTTGYDFLNRVNELLCDTRHKRSLTRTYRRFVPSSPEPAEQTVEKKRLILQSEMTGEIDNLARHLESLAASDRYAGDITLHGLRRALSEILSQFPVYRTYANEHGGSESDQRHTDQALNRARERRPALAGEIELVARFLLPRSDDGVSREERSRRLDFIHRLQQLSGPLMAKGYEDTALYTFNRFLAVNEVGGDLGRIGSSPQTFHRFIRDRAAAWPHSMNATATHDTKRGEDVRARLDVLSEIAVEWGREVKSWQTLHRPLKRLVHGAPCPDANDEYFLYQTLLGAWPVDDGELPGFFDRVKAYLVKSVREAKVHTAWIRPDEAYEEGFIAFFEILVDRQREHSFMDRLLPLCHRIMRWGWMNSLTQTLLKLTVPGVPDLYQGTELWDLSLVDPDNRRPVDFEKRWEYLEELRRKDRSDPRSLLQELLDDPRDGRVKMHLVAKALHLRRQTPDLFLGGDYHPLRVEGPKRRHVVAFARRTADHWLIAAAPRLPAGLSPSTDWPLGEEVWEDTRILLPAGDAPSRLHDVFTGEPVHAGSSLNIGGMTRGFPLILLLGKANAP